MLPISSTTATTVGDYGRTTNLEPPSSLSPKAFIEAGGKGIVPQTDAPTSASNSKERRVTIRCLHSSINLPVTTETTPTNILYSSANLMTHRIDPNTSIVVECFLQLGLERRLRRYERVREVLNSWDNDKQNSLLVLPCEVPEDSRDLDIESVKLSIDPPPGFTFYMYHSQRPGKWQKRFITLLETGQMFAAKKSGAKSSDKDSLTLCHLSDFDIYTPTESQMRKHLKPPKKFCYAIKSQQKPAVFINTDNFIHFFCTDDADLAQLFHKVVHGWRSWYLVNKKVDLSKTQGTPSPNKSTKPAPNKSVSVARSGGHQLKVSVDETPYTLGTFEPLMDMTRFDKPLEEFGNDFIPVPAKNASKPPIHRAKEIPRPKRLSKAQSSQPPAILPILGKEAEFSSNGLLGRGYEERKQAQAEATGDGAAGPFTTGPSLLNSTAEVGKREPKLTGNKESPSSSPPVSQQTARQRSQSMRRPSTSDSAAQNKQRQKPKPLVNLSSQSPESSRPWRSGQGHGIKVPTGVPLINMATGGTHQSQLNMPRQDLVRRDTKSGQSSSRGSTLLAMDARPRSKSISGVSAISRRIGSEEFPPVPPLPTRDMSRHNQHENARDRDAQQSDLPMRGRSGTIRS